jgi:hypothetical protein
MAWASTLLSPVHELEIDGWDITRVLDLDAKVLSLSERPRCSPAPR